MQTLYEWYTDIGTFIAHTIQFSSVEFSSVRFSSSLPCGCHWSCCHSYSWQCQSLGCFVFEFNINFTLVYLFANGLSHNKSPTADVNVNVFGFATIPPIGMRQWIRGIWHWGGNVQIPLVFWCSDDLLFRQKVYGDTSNVLLIISLC